MVREGDFSSLNQYARALEDSFRKLEEAYNKKNSEDFNRLKSLIIQTQRKILEEVKK